MRFLELHKPRNVRSYMRKFVREISNASSSKFATNLVDKFRDGLFLLVI